MIKICFFQEQNVLDRFKLFQTEDEYAKTYPNIYKAIKFCETHQQTKAETIMKSLIHSDPTNDIYHQYYANILYTEIMYEQVKYERELAFKLNPSHYNMALYAYMVARSQPQKGRKLYKKALKGSKRINLCLFQSFDPNYYATIRGSSNKIHLALAYSYCEYHPFNFRKAWKHLLLSKRVEHCCNLPAHQAIAVDGIQYLKILLSIGKYNEGLTACMSTTRHVMCHLSKQQMMCFERNRIYGHFLLNMERYEDAINTFSNAKTSATIPEQHLECCTAFVLCYSHLGKFNEANIWFITGTNLLNKDKKNKILPEVAIELYNAYSFLWYKKKLYKNRKRNREFSLKLESIPCRQFLEPRFKCVMNNSQYYVSYLFVYALHAQYNDNLLVEAITAYYLVLTEYPTAITYWHLSIAFHGLGYYGMSLKLLIKAWKMTPEIPTIAYGFQHKKQTLLNTIIHKYGCNKCGNKRNKLKACMGCCDVYYCSKKCQKMDWNNMHRINCDGKFKLIMKVIKGGYQNWQYYHKQLLDKFPKHISSWFTIRYKRNHALSEYNDVHF